MNDLNLNKIFFSLSNDSTIDTPDTWKLSTVIAGNGNVAFVTYVGQEIAKLYPNFVIGKVN
jgi:hypothetical protein